MQLFTIGHSKHTLDLFLGYLSQRGVTHLVDVRSKPYSRFSPHFNQRSLQGACSEDGINYIFKGKVLGGLTDNPGGPMANSLDAMIPWLEERPQARVAFMCSEGNPKECHRYYWLTNYLVRKYGVPVVHMHPVTGDFTRLGDLPELPPGLSANL